MKTYEIKIVRSIMSEAAPQVVFNARDVVKYVKANCFKPENAWREEVWVLSVDGANRITEQFLLGLGGTAAVVMDKKAVAKVAVETLAQGIILVHNHPSGNCRPSQSDIKQTGELKKALALFDIALLDHIILADGSFYSFADEEETRI